MMDSVKVIIKNEEYDILKGTTIGEVAKSFQSYFHYPIILAKMNNNTTELHKTVEKDCTIEFLDLTSKEGNKAHVNGLIFTMLYAVKMLYGKDADISVQHSIDKGIYIETTFDIEEKDVFLIKDKMMELTNSELVFQKLFADRLETMEHFYKEGNNVKADVLKYITDSHVTLYRLGNLYNYFYGAMPKDTSQLKSFDLNYIANNGFVLRFPTIYINDQIKPYTHYENMYEVFRKSRDWAKIMNVRKSTDLNKLVSSGSINDLIRINETLQSNELLKVAEDIHNNIDNIKIILLAGPTSSGKTTSTMKISMYLRSFGIKARMISMDDYFVERHETPIDEDGKTDFEALEAIDLKLFNEQVGQLLNKEEIVKPVYNFKMGTKEFKENIKLEDNEILFIEGIHALNDRILENIDRDKKYKIYISPLTELSIDQHNRLSTTDNRLLRRIIRDNRTRNYKVENTLERWASVRRGEEKHIFPYQGEANYTINSSMIYEFGVLKLYVEPLLYSVDHTSPYYEEAKRLINFLRVFLPIPSEAIPEDSVLREFIGGSCFHE